MRLSVVERARGRPGAGSGGWAEGGIDYSIWLHWWAEDLRELRVVEEAERWRSKPRPNSTAKLARARSIGVAKQKKVSLAAEL